MSVHEIENAIQQLPANDFKELMAWFDEYRQQRWDKQIEGDLEAGRLDALLVEVQRECQAGSAEPL